MFSGLPLLGAPTCMVGMIKCHVFGLWPTRLGAVARVSLMRLANDDTAAVVAVVKETVRDDMWRCLMDDDGYVVARQGGVGAVASLVAAVAWPGPR